MASRTRNRMMRIQQRPTVSGGPRLAWSRLLLVVSMGLGCSFAPAPAGSKDQCQVDADCVDGRICSPEQFCVAASALDVGTPDPRPDTGRPPQLDSGAGEPDLVVTDADRPDANWADREVAPEDSGNHPAEDAQLPGDTGRPDTGSPVPDQGIDCGGCPLGEACNRFGLCAPAGLECVDATDCPLGLECTHRFTCAPVGLDCADAAACADPAMTCNSFGSCVPRDGETSWCTLCGLDQDCGGPAGVCFDARYQDGDGRTGDGHCSAHCPDGQGCPSGFECRTYHRQGRSVNVCVIRAPSCEAWLTFNQECGCPAEGSFCEDLKDGARISFACTYACEEDGECPPGAICDSTWWHWNGFCRIP